MISETLSHYRIISKLGSGGMGEVYLAQDTRLGRNVALKILPADVAADESRMKRFVQEAKAASALNHQNIITIYEIGEAKSTHYIATEFVDGVTLRQKIRQGALSASEALDVAIQVCSALAAAHEAGIVHRDIKPDNIMLRSRDGFVKVLDFGLVKLTEPQSEATDTTALTAIAETEPGIVMGTVTYLSPEQARGLGVDPRTDVWSVGCVLYEMLAGRPPFAGETKTDLLAAIIKAAPAPLSRVAPETPARLEEIVAKALEKDREDRYQGVKDMLVDLRRLKRRIEFESEVERSTSFDSSGFSSSIVADRTQPSVEGQQPARFTNSTQIAQPTSSAEFIISEIRRHKTGATIVLGLVLTVFGGLTYWIYRFVSPKKPIAHFQKMKISKLTSSGNVSDVVISPDGKYVVYDVTDGGRQGLWAKYLPTGSVVQIVPPAEVFSLGNVTFSTDGNFVYYGLFDKKNPTGTIFQVPVLGGASKKIIEGVDSPIAFSPNGKQVAFIRSNSASKSSALLVANADGSEARQIVALSGDEWFSKSGLSWSPDGKSIVCGTGSKAGGEHMTLSAISVDSGDIKPLASQTWALVNRVIWLKDGSGIVFLAREMSAPNRQIWQLTHPGGELQRVTNDLNAYGDASLGVTADSTALVSMQLERTSDIWLATSNTDVNHAKQITARVQHANGFGGLAWTPDDRIVYASVASGNPDIWVMKPDGSEQKQLTDDPQQDYQPSISADGRFIVFASKRTGNWNIWRMDIDGGNLRRLTSGNDDEDPDISPDGRWVAYDSYEAGVSSVWRVSSDGGAPERISAAESAFPRFSPDGKLLAYLEMSNQGRLRERFVITQFSDGGLVKTIELPRIIPSNSNSLGWPPDGRALMYIDVSASGGGNVWSQPLDGSAAKLLTDFKTNSVFYFALSRDGKQLALSRGVITKDAVLISEVK